MSSYLGFIVALIVVLLLGKLVFKSIKVVVGFLINALIGFVILWILNHFGVGIPINLLTSAVVGFFGIPGILVLLVLKLIFHVI